MSEKLSNQNENRLMIAHFVDPNFEGRQFDEWPMHITVLPWFNYDKLSAITEIEAAVDNMRACRIALGETALKSLGAVELFGNDLDVPVRRIGDSTSLGVIHGMLLNQFHRNLEDKSYIGGNYNPHLTIRNNQDPGESSILTIDQLSLVEYGKPLKTIVRNYNLNDQTTT